MRHWVSVPLMLLLVGLLACTRTHELSAAERRHARDIEVASFATFNDASVVPDSKTSAAVTLDWQRALRGPHRAFAARGSVDDIFEKDGKYFLKVSDIDNNLLWMIQCSETEADDVRRQRDRTLEDLIVVEVSEIRPTSGEDSTMEVIGTLRKFQPSMAPL